MNGPDIQINRPLKECVDITGQRQYGKTKLAIEMIKINPNPMEIFDTLGVISKAVAAGELTLRPNQHIFNPNWNKNALPPDKEMAAVLSQWCEMVWRKGNCIAVVEECHLFCNGKWGMPPAFRNLFNQGGNNNIAVWVTSQAPAQVHNDILRACSHHFIFGLWMPQDLRFMEQFIPKKYVYADTKDDQEPEPNTSIDTLQPYFFMYYNTQTKTAQIFEPLDIA